MSGSDLRGDGRPVEGLPAELRLIDEHQQAQVGNAAHLPGGAESYPTLIFESQGSSGGRGVVMLVLAQGVSLACQMGGLIALSQLLAPAQFGIMAMLGTIIWLAALFSNFGLSLSTLAGEKPGQAERSNLMWLNVVAGTLVMVITIAAGPFVASFYHVPGLWLAVAVMSVWFLVDGVAAQFRIELNLAKKWNQMAKSRAMPQLVAIPVAIAVAALTKSYWALVVQSLVGAFLEMALVVWFARWKPSRYRRHVSVRRHLVFGRDALLVQIVNYAASNCDSMFIGRALGQTALGEYNRAYNLVTLPLWQLTLPLEEVMLPALAAAKLPTQATASAGGIDFTAIEAARKSVPALVMDGREAFLATMERCQRVICYIQLIPVSLLVGAAVPLVGVLLGPAWDQVPHLVVIQAIGACASGIGSIFWWALLSQRRTGQILRGQSIVQILMVIGMFVVVDRGNAAVAWVVAGGQAGTALASVYVCRRALAVPVLSVLRVALLPACISACAALAARFAGRAAWHGQVQTLFAELVACTAVWALAWLLFPRVRADVRLVVTAFRHQPST